jgi:hypothetical protein
VGTPLSPLPIGPDEAGAAFGPLPHPAIDSATSAATLKPKNLFMVFSFAAFAALKILLPAYAGY